MTLCQIWRYLSIWISLVGGLAIEGRAEAVLVSLLVRMLLWMSIGCHDMAICCLKLHLFKQIGTINQILCKLSRATFSLLILCTTPGSRILGPCFQGKTYHSNKRQA